MTDSPWLEHYDPGVPAQIEVQEVTVPAMLERAAAAYPDRVALIFQSARLPYRQLARDVGRLATAFARLGVVEGTRVAVHLPNVPQTVIAYFAALKAGAEVVLTNPMYTAREIEHQWGDAGCELAVTADYLFERVLQGIRGSLPVREYVVASIPEYLRFPLNRLAPVMLARRDPPLWARVSEGEGVHRFRTLVRRTPARPASELDFQRTAALQYTGGTTGRSKGAILTHRNLSANVQQIDAWFHEVEEGSEVMLACLPLFHVFGMTVAMNWALSKGMTVVLVPDPRDGDALLGTIERHRVTLFPGVPAMYATLNGHPRAGSGSLSSVKVCVSGSAPLPGKVKRRFEELTGATIVEGFGLSETSPVTHCGPLRGERRPGSIGLPLSSTDAKVMDTDDPTRQLPPGEAGELYLRGPQVMAGYWNRPQETAAVLREGWFASGDLATMSEEGYFRIVGRKKDMINCSGFKVYPDEVDEVLLAHESIAEAATIGVPDPERGETVCSYVVLEEGAQLAADDVRAWCRARLAAFKVPRDVEFVDALPRSAVQKILRHELREQAQRDQGE